MICVFWNLNGSVACCLCQSSGDASVDAVEPDWSEEEKELFIYETEDV